MTVCGRLEKFGVPLLMIVESGQLQAKLIFLTYIPIKNIDQNELSSILQKAYVPTYCLALYA